MLLIFLAALKASSYSSLATNRAVSVDVYMGRWVDVYQGRAFVHLIKKQKDEIMKMFRPPLSPYIVLVFFVVIRKKEEMMKIFRPPLSPAPSKDPVEPEKEKGEA